MSQRIIIIGMSNYEAFMAELEKIAKEDYGFIVVEGHVPAQPTEPILEEQPFILKNYEPEKELFDLEQQLDIPSRLRYHNRQVKLPAAPIVKRHFKPNRGHRS